MSIRDPVSDWYIPPDWRLFLAMYIFTIITPIAIILVLSILTMAAHGDATLSWVAISLGAVGVVLLFLARWPMYRQRRFLSFGPRELSAGHRKLYGAAYGFIGASIVIMVLLLIMGK